MVDYTFIAMADWDYNRCDNGQPVFGSGWEYAGDMLADYEEYTPGSGYAARYYEVHEHTLLGYVILVFHHDGDWNISCATSPNYMPPWPYVSTGFWSAWQPGHASPQKTRPDLIDSSLVEGVHFSEVHGTHFWYSPQYLEYAGPIVGGQTAQWRYWRPISEPVAGGTGSVSLVKSVVGGITPGPAAELAHANPKSPKALNALFV